MQDLQRETCEGRRDIGPELDSVFCYERIERWHRNRRFRAKSKSPIGSIPRDARASALVGITNMRSPSHHQALRPCGKGSVVAEPGASDVGSFNSEMIKAVGH
jgi:hypothetical protein